LLSSTIAAMLIYHISLNGEPVFTMNMSSVMKLLCYQHYAFQSESVENVGTFFKECILFCFFILSLYYPS
jgi:hypothetical protein